MNSQGPQPGLFASLRALLASTLDLARTRLELLGIELEEEKLRILSLLGYGVAALLLLCAGSVFLAIFLTVLFWDGYRLLALGLFTTLFLVTGGVALALAVNHGRAGSRLFSTSLAEMEKDRVALGSGEGTEHR